ncbi:hypothetical protein HYQ45_003440 [Verticillium longisporum]|uniref:Secreted protein n=1 Tax=Verticillium longisporum TaxID=100787 RepID=A0A8I2ZVB9_VERLO|nr:hypothetical protein HYQ45_003440 [Verticillium longisporum]
MWLGPAFIPLLFSLRQQAYRTLLPAFLPVVIGGHWRTTAHGDLGGGMDTMQLRTSLTNACGGHQPTAGCLIVLVEVGRS